MSTRPVIISRCCSICCQEQTTFLHRSFNASHLRRSSTTKRKADTEKRFSTLRSNKNFEEAGIDIFQRQSCCGRKSQVQKFIQFRGVSTAYSDIDEGSDRASPIDKALSSSEHGEKQKHLSIHGLKIPSKTSFAHEAFSMQQIHPSIVAAEHASNRESSQDAQLRVALKSSVHSLPLGIEFEKFFMQLIALHHRYPEDPGRRKQYFRFKNYLTRPELADLTGEQLKAWVLNHPWNKIGSVLLHLILGSLVVSARQTLFVLASLGPIRDNFRNRMRCLRYVFWAHNQELREDENLMAQFDKCVAALRNSNEWPDTGMNEAQTRLILNRSDAKNVEMFIQRYLGTYETPGPEPLAEFARSYMRSGKTDEAVEMLLKMPGQALQQPSNTVLITCRQLLWHDTIVKTESGPNFNYLPRLLEKGFRPDAFLHSRIVAIALNAHYPNVAWDLYHYLNSIGAVIHPWTYSLLLRHSFLSRDISGLNEMMSAIHNKEELYTDRYLLAYSMNMVRVISFYERGCSADEALTHILALYDRAYNRGSLIKIGIVTEEAHTDRASEMSDPTPLMLGYTIWSYILCHRLPHLVQRWWNWIRHLAEQGDDKILRALEHDIIYNGFILFHTRRSTTLLYALDVVQYMLEKKYCLPTSRTWSILVCGFLKHGQLEQAQKVVDMMDQHGFRYTSVSEEHLPSGYRLEDLNDQKDAILDELSVPEELGLDQPPFSLSAWQSAQPEEAQYPHDSSWNDVIKV